jgi:DNA-3-methyladenine glycosylase
VTTLTDARALPSLRDPPRDAVSPRGAVPRQGAGPSPVALPPLERDFFARPAVELAAALLGKLLVRESAGVLSAGVIVETEAYAGPADRASHARAGKTRRTAPMFGPPGHAYVYLVYGIHSCLNVVSETEGSAGAVLLRALEPLMGLDAMRTRRSRAARDRSTVTPDARLCAGPAVLCQALDIDRSLDGRDLTLGRDLWLAEPDAVTADRIAAVGVVRGPRIGVDYAGEWASRPWRFGVAGSPSLSRPFTPRRDRRPPGGGS